ncbi:MAG: hypothetical protein P1U57_05080 [Oleibacter sp.]|nr:hypothetical protein [Thalassolituus sp.]
MNKQYKERLKIGVLAIGLGVFCCLEGLGITTFKDLESDSRWVPILVGLPFLFAGISVICGKEHPKLNDFLAFLITGLMGLLFLWGSFLGSPSGFSGNVILSRIMFGAGSVCLFSVSLYAFICFIKKASNK